MVYTTEPQKEQVLMRNNTYTCRETIFFVIFLITFNINPI